ncbi:MAG: ankyrin repeat domain-containing protein, partial [Spirulina sp. SIO3F2]|nr:ankyrin repeat domain-containing protein [Spirulina sp. SIO3F2]
ETIPLHHAAKLGQREMVQTLIEAGADIAATDHQDKTATAIAVYEGHQDIVDLLKKAGASSELSYTEQSEDALMGAAKQGNVKILQAALEAGVDPNLSVPLTGRHSRRRRNVLMFAAQEGHLEAVQCLVAGGANVNLSDRPGKRFGRTPLMYAASSGHGDVVRFLLESGAIVDAQDKRGQTALFYAVEKGSAAAVQVLLEFGADPHKQSWEGTPFKRSEYAGYEVRELFAQEAVKNTDPEDKTALEAALRSAALNGYIDIAQNLIQQGVDVNSTQFNTEEDYIDIPVDKNTTLMYRTNQDGWTPLFASVIHGHLEIVELLLSNGADVGIATALGKTPLSEAVYWGHEAIVRRFLSAGADINHIDQDQGLTPLMNTVDFERVEILQILLDAGADVTIRNKKSRTVFELALKENKQAILDVLHQFGVTA